MTPRPMPGPPQWYESAGLGDWDDRGRWCNRWDLHWEDGRAEFDVPERHDKRLTDAECAVEYWRALTVQLATPHGAPWGSRWEEGRRAATWHRFVTHPHALEIDGAAS